MCYSVANFLMHSGVKYAMEMQKHIQSTLSLLDGHYWFLPADTMADHENVSRITGFLHETFSLSPFTYCKICLITIL